MAQRNSNPSLSPSSAHQRREPFWYRRGAGSLAISLLLFITVVWTFFPSLHNDFIDYDDDRFVTQNAYVQSGLTWSSVGWAFRTPVVGNWHPLTTLSHMLDCQLYGLKPRGHHLTNVLLHALNTVLLFLLFRRMTGAVWRCVILALCFALHPLRVESVAWISERKDVLSTLFWMLTLLAYARYAQQSEVKSPKSIVAYLAALLCFVCGLMSKPMVVTLPFVLLLLDYWPLKRFEASAHNSKLESLLRLLREKLPFFALAAVFSAATYVLQRGTGAVVTNLPVGARIANALVSYIRYIGKMFWPTDLSPFYPYPAGWGWATVLLCALALAGISVFAVVSGRRHRYLPTGWFWFVGTLVPVIGLVQVGGQGMADRYSYIPGIGLLLMLVWGAHELTARWRHQAVVLSAMAVAAVLVCMGLTRRQIGYWKDGETLWRHALSVTKENATAHYNLGYALTKAQRFAEAVHHYKESLRLKPGDAEAHNNLGSILAVQNRKDEAIERFTEALRLAPDFLLARYNLGLACASLGHYREAAAHFREVVRLDPNHPSARRKLEQMLATLESPDQAVEAYREVLRSRPGDARVHGELGRVLLETGRLDEALKHWAEAARLEPRSAGMRYQLGVALTRNGETEKAARQFEVALELEPKFAAAHHALGIVCQHQGQVPDALRHWREAARLAPQWPDPVNNLAWARATDPRAEVRNGPEAVKLAERAVELSGTNNVGVLDTLAAAYAEAGRFAEASATARRAEAAATAQGRTELAEQIRQRLALYSSNRPYRESEVAR